MNRYRYKFSYSLVYVFTIMIAVLSQILFDNSIVRAIELLCLVASIVGIINNLVSYIKIDNNLIIEKNLFKCKKVQINEINQILLMPTSNSNKYFIGVYTKNQSMFISSWYKNNIDLITQIIKNCNSTEVKIDFRVSEFINL